MLSREWVITPPLAYAAGRADLPVSRPPYIAQAGRADLPVSRPPYVAQAGGADLPVSRPRLPAAEMLIASPGHHRR